MQEETIKLRNVREGNKGFLIRGGLCQNARSRSQYRLGRGDPMVTKKMKTMRIETSK